MLLWLTAAALTAASPVGVWQTIDDSTNEPRAHVEIIEKNGVYTGRIVHLVDPDAPEPKCDKCSGTKKDQPIVGLEILWDLKKEGTEYKGGHILDPENGKTYDCKIWLESEDRLRVRGSWLFIGRTQTWRRLKTP